MFLHAPDYLGKARREQDSCNNTLKRNASPCLAICAARIAAVSPKEERLSCRMLGTSRLAQCKATLHLRGLLPCGPGPTLNQLNSTSHDFAFTSTNPRAWTTETEPCGPHRTKEQLQASPGTASRWEGVRKRPTRFFKLPRGSVTISDSTTYFVSDKCINICNQCRTKDNGCGYILGFCIDLFWICFVFRPGQ